MSGHRIAGRRVWLVGASSGIGAALARECVRRGARVAVSARRVQRLAEVADDRMVAVAADVTDRAGVDAAAAAVREALGGLDMVVYNAGYWEQTDAAAWDRDAFTRHVEVNLLGFNNVIGATLPEFVARGCGHLVGVASIAGYRGLVGAEAYGATKAAQINMLEAMRGALAPRGVAVTTVCPGFVRTEMTAGNDFPMPFMIEPVEAAAAIARGLERGQQEIVFPLPMTAAFKAARLLPVRAWTALNRRTVRPRRRPVE
ncbi:oxidoreductase [Pilimelia terevasa]|uniref:Oxidoreductase n=1 Tax=Pilimelia terevasa TaxID=53372 RepID=A0A8J3BUY5_9ACTN|nr:SDR family NAD(P)-dependent oxidoreductase [Pilimelia terevasa]GGK42688.1 oxidoreductase [Pilimelia terevasa]